MPFGFTLMSRPRQSSVMVLSTRDPSLVLQDRPQDRPGHVRVLALRHLAAGGGANGFGPDLQTRLPFSLRMSPPQGSASTASTGLPLFFWQVGGKVLAGSAEQLLNLYVGAGDLIAAGGGLSAAVGQASDTTTTNRIGLKDPRRIPVSPLWAGATLARRFDEHERKIVRGHLDHLVTRQLLKTPLQRQSALNYEVRVQAKPAAPTSR